MPRQVVLPAHKNDASDQSVGPVGRGDELGNRTAGDDQRANGTELGVDGGDARYDGREAAVRRSGLAAKRIGRARGWG